MKCLKDVKAYNVIFPVWMLMLFPQMWLIVIPANFIVDSSVLFLSLLKLKIDDKKDFYKKHILKIFGFGMLSDVIGALLLFSMLMLGISQTSDEIYITLPAVIISAVCIYMFNYYITFKYLDKDIRYKLSMIYAIITAPYTFLIPISWIY